MLMISSLDLLILLILSCASKKFHKVMQQEFGMSIMGELTFFHGLQIKQVKHDFFIHNPNTTTTKNQQNLWLLIVT